MAQVTLFISYFTTSHFYLIIEFLFLNAGASKTKEIIQKQNYVNLIMAFILTFWLK